jgi:hypothetical protein
MADYQTVAAADAVADRDKWIEAHRAFAAGLSALASTTTLTHDFIAAALSDPNAWVGMSSTVQQIHKGLTGGFHHFDLVWRAHVPSAQFVSFGARHMTMLDSLIASIFEDAKNIGKIQRQHAYITDLCKRVEAAQHHIHLKVQDQLIPTCDTVKTELAETTEKLRTERKRLIEIKLDGASASAASASALAANEEARKAAALAAADITNAAAATASEAAAAASVAAAAEAEEVAAAAALVRAAMEADMKQQLDDMRAKLAAAESKLNAKDEADNQTSAAARAIALHEENQAKANAVLDMGRAAQQAKMKARLVERQRFKVAQEVADAADAEAFASASAATEVEGAVAYAPHPMGPGRAYRGV